MESKLRSVLRLLVKYDECVEKIEEKENRRNELKEELRRLEEKVDTGHPVFWIILLVIGVVFLFVIWPIGVCLLLASPISYCSSCNKREYPVYKYRVMVYEPETELLAAEKEALNAEKEAVWSDFCTEATFLPMKYHDKFAIAHMIISFKKGDATTLEEAIALYEGEVLSAGHEVLDRYRDHYVTMALE